MPVERIASITPVMADINCHHIDWGWDWHRSESTAYVTSQGIRPTPYEPFSKNMVNAKLIVRGEYPDGSCKDCEIDMKQLAQLLKPYL